MKNEISHAEGVQSCLLFGHFANLRIQIFNNICKLWSRAQLHKILCYDSHVRLEFKKFRRLDLIIEIYGRLFLRV